MKKEIKELEYIANGVIVENDDKTVVEEGQKKRLLGIAFTSVRKQTGMNRKEFAEWLGIPYRTMQDWELGTSQKYCRALYEAGYAPVCPFLSQTWFLCTDVPQEYTDARDMAHEFLRRSRILVVCGKKKTKSMMEDIAVAKKYGIATVTLDGIISIAKERDGK
ncbi:MAG: hypothetical protein K6A71_05780 [Lachnospiraceae bacterium]|nr:hypothetical protein [Lachnospiraceae bacterium]